MDDERQKLFYIMGVGMQFGFMVAITMAALLVGGVYLDRALKTGPLFTITGVILGFVGAGLEMRHVVIPFLEKRQNSQINKDSTDNNIKKVNSNNSVNNQK